MSEYVLVFCGLLELIWVRDDNPVYDTVVETVLVTPVGKVVILTVFVGIEVNDTDIVLLDVLLGVNE